MTMIVAVAALPEERLTRDRVIGLVLGFVGVRDPEFVLAEGIASGEHNKSRALASARDAVGQLAA